ncbi:hypothetical protein HGA64_00765 [Candidatus Falkowbacteria bacterium]|nr:hypothetical protein [Candidatus Falkowbacteria bacterium]
MQDIDERLAAVNFRQEQAAARAGQDDAYFEEEDDNGGIFRQAQARAKQKKSAKEKVKEEMKNKKEELLEKTVLDGVERSAWLAVIETFGLSIFVLDFIWIRRMLKGRSKLLRDAAIILVSLLYWGIIMMILCYVLVYMYIYTHPWKSAKLFGKIVVERVLGRQLGPEPTGNQTQ